MGTRFLPRRLEDVDEIATRLAGDRAAHVYELGDLDPFFFARCSYFGHPDTNATALLYDGSSPSTLLALGRVASADLIELACAIVAATEGPLYAHLAPGIAQRIEGRALVGLESHLKLARSLDSWTAATGPSSRDDVMALGPEHERAAQTFYAEAYPGSWFTPRMLHTGVYRAVVDGAAWRAIAGVHVLSKAGRVAALGNVATHPAHRGRGLGQVACAAVLDALAGAIDLVGLNVAADNDVALRLYRRLGFEPVCAYEEVLLR